MSMLNRLLDQLRNRGLYIEVGDDPNQLLLSGNTREATPEVMKALKMFKPQLLG